MLHNLLFFTDYCLFRTFILFYVVQLILIFKTISLKFKYRFIFLKVNYSSEIDKNLLYILLRTSAIPLSPVKIVGV
jgi:hypothetical protein